MRYLIATMLGLLLVGTLPAQSSYPRQQAVQRQYTVRGYTVPPFAAPVRPAGNWIYVQNLGWVFVPDRQIVPPVALPPVPPVVIPPFFPQLPPFGNTPEYYQWNRWQQWHWHQEQWHNPGPIPPNLPGSPVPKNPLPKNPPPKNPPAK